jgi:phage-related tail fiber protein
MTMSLIQTVTVGSGGAASIEFTSIPQDGTDLVVLASVRGSSNEIIFLQINNSASNFSTRALDAFPTVESSSNTDSRIGYASNQSSTANTFGSLSLYLLNYTSSSNKTFSVDYVDENNDTTTSRGIRAGLWSNTAAITSLTFTLGGVPGSDNFPQNCTFSLYKITKGSDGIVTTS